MLYIGILVFIFIVLIWDRKAQTDYTKMRKQDGNAGNDKGLRRTGFSSGGHRSNEHGKFRIFTVRPSEENDPERLHRGIREQDNVREEER